MEVLAFIFSAELFHGIYGLGVCVSEFFEHVIVSCVVFVGFPCVLAGQEKSSNYFTALLRGP